MPLIIVKKGDIVEPKGFSPVVANRDSYDWICDVCGKQYASLSHDDPMLTEPDGRTVCLHCKDPNQKVVTEYQIGD